MKISVKKKKATLRLSIDEANILLGALSTIKAVTNVPVFIGLTDELVFKLSSAVTFIANTTAYKDGN